MHLCCKICHASEEVDAFQQTKYLCTYAHLHYKPCSGLLEDISMNVHHEITTTGILHHKEDMGICLEAAGQVHQEWMLHCIDSLKNPLLRHQTVHLISGNDISLLQNLDSHQVLHLLVFC